MTIYAYNSQLSEELVRLRCVHGKQPWTRGTVRGCDKICAVTKEKIARGERCWKPITNAANRGDRISEEGMRMLREAKK